MWDEISDACERDELIEGTISARVKGGLSVTIRGGVKAFLPGLAGRPAPGAQPRRVHRQELKFKVIKFNKKRGNIVLSRRVLLEKERAELKEQTLEKLKEGQIVEGIVKNLTEYGAFIDLGGIDGLLHITDMSWGRVNHPSELFQVGDHVRVKVLKFNSETERVCLGLKQISEDPWTHAPEKYPPGTVVKGKVVSLKDYGAFIELEQGIEGLVHISEMSWTRRVKHPSKMVAVGDMVEAVVLDIDPRQNRISLGMKQLEPNPYESLKEKYPPGTVVKGVVRNIADFGIFVEIEEGIDGLVHISDMTWTQRVKHPSELYKKGDEVEAVVLNIDTDGEKPKISLGIKQLVPDPWDRIPYDYPVGKIVDAKVIKVLDFGAFVELEKGIEGLIHVSEFSDERVEDPKAVRQAGQNLKAEIISSTRPSERSACRSAAPRAPRRWPTRRATRAAPRPRRWATSCATSWRRCRAQAKEQDEKGRRRTPRTTRRASARPASRPCGPRGRNAPDAGGEPRRGVPAPPPADRGGARADDAPPSSRTLAWLRRFAKLWGFALFCIFIVYIVPRSGAAVHVRDPRRVHPGAGRRSVRAGARSAASRSRAAWPSSSFTSTSSRFCRSSLAISSRKLSGDFARMFREAPQLVARVNREWVPRAGAWIDSGSAPPTTARDRTRPTADEATDGAPTPRRSAGAPAAAGLVGATPRPTIVVEPLPEREDARRPAVARLEVQPTPGGGYLISPAHAENAENTGGR